MARQPAKILLAIMAVISIFMAGNLIDGIWSMFGQHVPEGDIVKYVTSSQAEYNDALEKWNSEENRLSRAIEIKVKYLREKHSLNLFQRFSQIGGSKFGEVFNTKLDEYNKENEKDYSTPYIGSEIESARKNDKNSSKFRSEAQREYKTALKKINLLLDPSFEQAEKEIKENATLKQNAEKQELALEQLDKQYDNALRAIVELKVLFQKDELKIKGRRIFKSFVDYQVSCAKNALASMRSGHIMSGMNAYEQMISKKAIIPMSIGSPNSDLLANLEQRNQDGFGFVPWILMFAQGVIWLICEHTLFAVLFGTSCLAIWALFGGAIHRMAAIHAAREEMISIPQALKFARGKFWSFFFAPLLPLGIIFVLGIVLVLIGVIGNIPGIGALIMGILIAIALLISMVMTFLLIGLFAGSGLMYPTIAVEGSDTFDALNRSVSFTFSHPWKSALYGLVAFLGGSVWYIFARIVAYLTLTCAHWFIKIGVFSGGTTLAKNADKLDLIWPAPTFSDLHPPCSWAAMSWSEALAAGMISIWVYLVIATIAAVMITYFSSAATMIYYLLRRKVDAADLDEVYVEEAEDELYYEETTPEQSKSQDQPADSQPEQDNENQK